MTKGPAPMNKARLAAARELLAAQGLDALLVSHAADVRYLSGFRGEDAALVIAADVALICTDSRFWAQVHEEVVGFELLQTQDLLADVVAGLASKLGAGVALGFQGAAVSYAGHRLLRRLHHGRLRDVGERVSALRMVKDAAEIEAVRRAAAMADAALEQVAETGIVGRAEEAVAWQIRAALRELGAAGPSFDTLVAAGDHGAQGHAIAGGRRIAAGDLVVIDTGARCDGYCSDITRTFAAGHAGEEQRRIYDIVLRAQREGLAAVRHGVNGREVDAAARAVIERAGYGAQFGHGTGHGVGLEIHEAPRLGRRRGDPLAAGMIVTVEPGIYLEGELGVRIEDTVLVGESGGEALTGFPKELVVVE
jgi:Xaa-Pro aminopeptidase